MARYYRDYNWFVIAVLGLRRGFYNFGCKLALEDSGSQNKFNNWEKKHGPTVKTYIRDVWNEFLGINNAISFWRTGGPRPIVLPPEKCRYDDRFGIERLFVRHGLTPAEIDELPAKLRKLYTGKTEIEILPEDGQFFKVLKEAPMGHGLSKPGMASVFAPLKQIEGMEAGDNVLAHESRMLVKQHLFGHEIKSGPKAGSPQHFLHKSTSDAAQRGFKGAVGLVEVFTNFDQTIKHHYVDPKWFDTKKYDGAERRILWWSLPLGQMVMARGGVAPFLMNLLQVQAEDARELVLPHLVEVINKAFDPPYALTVKWSNRVFRESRLATDLLKMGLQIGPISQRTFREEAGFDDIEERERKRIEALQPEAETWPIFEPSQGKLKGQPGRTRGTPDEGKT